MEFVHTSSPLGPFARHDVSCALPYTHVAAWCLPVCVERGLESSLAGRPCCPRRHGKSQQSCGSLQPTRRHSLSETVENSRTENRAATCTAAQSAYGSTHKHAQSTQATLMTSDEPSPVHHISKYCRALRNVHVARCSLSINILDLKHAIFSLVEAKVVRRRPKLQQ